MHNDPSTDRRYTDEEVGKILARAVEPRAPHPGTQAGRDDGYTLAEVEAIAAEAGIDPRRIREAAVALTTGDAGTAGLAGSPTKWFAERIVAAEGREVTTAQIAAAIRRVTKTSGIVTETDDLVEWRPEDHEGQELKILVTRGRNRLTLSVFGEGGVHNFLVWGGTMSGAFIVGGAAAITILAGDGSWVWSLAAWAGTMATGGWIARKLWRRVWDRVQGRWVNLVDRVAAELEEAVKD